MKRLSETHNANPEVIRVLLVEDDSEDVPLLREILAEAKNVHFNIESVARLQAGLEQLSSGGIDIILLDLDLPGSHELDTLDKLHAQAPELPILVLAALHDEMLGVKALQKGAQDYLVKGRMGGDSMARCVRYAIERKRIEEALRESEEKFRAIFDNALDGILVADLESKRFYTCNEMICQMLGYDSMEEVKRLSVMDIHPAKDLPHVMERFEAQLRGELSLAKNILVRRKDGTVFYADVNSSLVTFAGKTYLMSIFRDVTERKRAEAALERERALLAQRVEERTVELKTANLELARANRLKDEFLANMSHELRTPLTVILGMAEVLQINVQEPLSAKQCKWLQRIEESGSHLLELINDILDVAKIGADKLELHIQPVSIESVCQASVRLVSQQAHKKRLRVSLSVDSTVTTIHADGRRLKEILVNLLSNAVKFTPEGGNIGLEVVADVEQQMAHFTVWDTGIGIPQEKMELLFQPFVQLDGSLSRGHSGTGLGLTLVKKTTELHSGSVSVESEVGKGSRFIVSLPWQEAAEGADAESDMSVESQTASVVKHNQVPKSEQPLILLAEDDEGIADLISDFLSFSEYHVIIAQNGHEAVRLVKEEKPDIVLMDIHMPDMDGLNAISHIRADADVSDTPIIALTALAMIGDRERCLEAGADDYIIKPVHFKDLIRAIEAQLHRESDATEVVPNGTE